MLPIAIGTLLPAGYGQVVVHSGEEIFVIAVQGSREVTFRGSHLVTAGTGESTDNAIAGTVPAEFSVVGTSVYLSVQRQSPGGEIEITISKNGGTVKRQRTSAPYGVVTLASTRPPGGAPRQTEFRANGSVKFAFLTLTSETGDTEQQLVPVPFSKTFFPKQGWIVGLLAQKTRVTRPDPLYLDGRIEVLDDAVRGSVHVAIVVNGSVLKEAEASEPYGVASVAVRVP